MPSLFISFDDVDFYIETYENYKLCLVVPNRATFEYSYFIIWRMPTNRASYEQSYLAEE